MPCQTIYIAMCIPEGDEARGGRWMLILAPQAGAPDAQFETNCTIYESKRATPDGPWKACREAGQSFYQPGMHTRQELGEVLTESEVQSVNEVAARVAGGKASQAYVYALVNALEIEGVLAFGSADVFLSMIDEEWREGCSGWSIEEQSIYT
ncbi:hypothetical protein BJY00DRAFT_316970 [Aspergillus carlsbadensis]|nr:hypothetical protein BJY00DRAFT_316970 [Aspergillus carlsbadensis]